MFNPLIASPAKEPSEGSGTATPSPKKDKKLSVKIEDGTTIYPNVVIEGTTKIGKNTIIHAGCYIKDSNIGDNTVIYQSQIEKSQIGNNCTIGPYTNIRPNNISKKNVKIGSFVELKNSTIGNKTKIKVVKNKLAPPFKTVEFEIMYGKGISKEGCVLDMAVQYGIIQKTGSWFAYNDEKIGQGKENAKQYLVSHPEVLEEVERLVREKTNTN